MKEYTAMKRVELPVLWIEFPLRTDNTNKTTYMIPLLTDMEYKGRYKVTSSDEYCYKDSCSRKRDTWDRSAAVL